MSKNLDEIGFKLIMRELDSLGIKEHEALVYLSLLRLGETGTGPLIKSTALHGQYVYQSLDRLEHQGLAQHVIKRGRRKYSAKSPQTLLRLAEDKKTRTELLVTRLNQFAILPPEQAFEIYQGEEAYVAHEFDLLGRASEGSELLIVGGVGDKFNDAMGDRLREYAFLQRKKDISMRYIGSEDQRVQTADMHGRRHSFKIRYLPGLFTGQVNTNIWPDALGFNIYGEPVTRFTVFSPIVAASYKQFFETLWNLAKE